jgi:hypothetical protein
MATPIKRFNWVKRPSHWEYAQAWRAQRSNMARRFQEDAALAASAFAGAQNNLAVGKATLAAQASILRTQNQINEVKARLTSASSQVNLLA